MSVIVYVEMIWIINWLIDWSILLLTQSVLYIHVKWTRVCFAGLIGSLIVLLQVFFPHLYFEQWYIKFLHSVVMILVAFGFISFSEMMKRLFTFYFMTFTIGGGLLGIHFMFDNSNLFENEVRLSSSEIHVIFVAILFPAICIFTKKRMDKHKYFQFKKDFLYQVSVLWRNKQAYVSGYVDSGNHLIDPLTNKPVIIGDENFLEPLFNCEEWKELLEWYRLLEEGAMPEDCPYRLVPYKGINGETKWLIAFSPDKVSIYLDKNHQHECEDVLIGVKLGTLVSDNSYHCLLHPKLFLDVS
jgi:stage II sporulation protein GA (sporulation sigma-E factor processing peptidase)